MCGIAGVLAPDTPPAERTAVVDAMTRALAHRGPDAHHTWSDASISLGHRRLAIVDLRRDGDQPMTTESADVWIVFNGEIYNHEELRAALEARGERFRTRTDTEVLLRLYRWLGEDCLGRLRGMFAFAIWDSANRKLFLARDRLGKKPLYYHAAPGRFAFASEIKGLLRDGEVPRDVDPEALHHFLSFDYVPAPLSAYAKIRKLPAGHALTVEGDRIRETRYWRASYAPVRPLAERRALEEEIHARLGQAVRMRLMSDVPVGVLLSGGIDSSAIVALLAEAGKADIATFSLAMEDRDRDESAYARLVANAFGTRHQEFLFRAEDVELLPRVLAHCDEPFGDPSILPTWVLCEHAARSVTVVLSGEGGDECFAGYDRYVKSRLARRWNALPAVFRKGAAAMFRGFAGLPHDHLLKRLQEFFALGPRSNAELHCQWLLHFEHGFKRRLYSDEFWRMMCERDSRSLVLAAFDDSDATDDVNAALDVDSRSYLPDDLLVKLDRATMAHSIEGRTPFLDHELFESIASLPGSLKLHGLTTKWILRRALASELPREILGRPKAGFGIPVHRWLRKELRDLATDTLGSSRARQRGYFRPREVERLLEEHVAGRRNWGFQLWNLLALEIWHREVVDAQVSSERITSESARR